MLCTLTFLKLSASDTDLECSRCFSFTNLLLGRRICVAFFALIVVVYCRMPADFCHLKKHTALYTSDFFKSSILKYFTYYPFQTHSKMLSTNL